MRPIRQNPLRLPRWLYRDKWGSFYYRGPKLDGTGRIFVNIGKVPIAEARARWVELTPFAAYLRLPLPRRRAPRKCGVLYALEAVGAKHIKIGFSESVDGVISRVRSLQTGCPFPIRLLGRWPGSTADEAEAHRHLAPWRTSGEWFSADAAVIRFVNERADNCHTSEPPTIDSGFNEIQP